MITSSVLVTTSKALVIRSDAIVPSSLLFLICLLDFEHSLVDIIRVFDKTGLLRKAHGERGQKSGYEVQCAPTWTVDICRY